MKRNIFILFIMALCVSCVKDDTTNAVRPISIISIEKGSVGDLYDIDKNEHLLISPKVTQSISDKELYYTWEIDQQVYSHDSVFNFVGDRLGSFQCRLIVENEDGKAFATFRLNVNSPYEEGLTIISCDPEGQSRLSFMMKQREEGIEDFFYEGDCFAINNPEYPFAAGVADALQCDESLVIACKGDSTKGEPATIYSINEKTFTVENIVEVPEYADFIPYKMMLPGTGSVGADYPILCENGKVYLYSPREGAVGQPDNFKSTYSLSAVIYDSGNSYYNNIIFWDKELSDLCLLYNGYGPFYCGEDYLLAKDSVNMYTNYFHNYEFVFMFLPRTTEVKRPYAEDVIVVTKSAVTYQKVTIASGFWTYNELTGTNELAVYGGMKMVGFGCELNETTPHIASAHHGTLYYGKGNALKEWEYTFDNKFLNATPTLTTVGSSNAIISAMELNADHTELFIAYYEPDEEGLNGYVQVVDPLTGDHLRRYDNVSYKPVKIFYKYK